jgi:hypothetical protein
VSVVNTDVIGGVFAGAIVRKSDWKGAVRSDALKGMAVCGVWLVLAGAAVAQTAPPPSTKPAGPDEGQSQTLRLVATYGMASSFLNRCSLRPRHEVHAIGLVAKAVLGDFRYSEVSTAYGQGRNAADKIDCNDDPAYQYATRIAQRSFMAVTAWPGKEVLCGWQGDQAALDAYRKDTAEKLSQADLDWARTVAAGIKPTQCLPEDYSREGLRSIYNDASSRWPYLLR